MECKVSDLVKRGHDKVAELESSCGAVDVRDVAQLISDLATQLDVQLARSNALAAENANCRKAVQVFCDVVDANTDAICEEVGQDGVKAILAAMSATGNMPATDDFLAEVRASGVDALVERRLTAARLAKEAGHEITARDLEGEAIRARVFAMELRKGVQS